MDNLALFDFIKNKITSTENNNAIEIFHKPQKEISDHKWTFQSQEISSIIRKLGKNSIPLGDFDGMDGICKIFKSVESGKDTTKINDVVTGVFRVTKDDIIKNKLEKIIKKT